MPEIDKLDGIAGATFSPADGLINPNLLKEHYRAARAKLGAQFLDRAYVVAIDAGASRSAHPDAGRPTSALTDEGLDPHDDPGRPGRSRNRPSSSSCTPTRSSIAGGAWSPSALKLLGLNN